MKIEKFDSTSKVGRVPLARGDFDKICEVFVLSILADGSGVVLEFADDEAYFLPTQELVAEFLKERDNYRREDASTL